MVVGIESDNTLVFLLKFSLFVKFVEVTPMATDMFAFVFLKFLSALHHFVYELLASANGEVVNYDILAPHGAVGKHGHFVVAHRDLYVAVSTVCNLFISALVDGVGRKVIKTIVRHGAYALCPLPEWFLIFGQHVLPRTAYNIGTSS